MPQSGLSCHSFTSPIYFSKLNCDFKKRSKNAFLVILPVFCAYVGQPDDHTQRLRNINALRINLFYSSKDWNFREKILRIGRVGKWHFFGFWLLGFSKKNGGFCFFPMKICLAFIWGIIYCCTMNGFFRIIDLMTVSVQ